MMSHPLGLYIHWPFCLSKCPYCDFNSFVSASVDYNAFEHAYLFEMNRYHAQTATHTLKTIFFGGGTPSLMPPRLVQRLIEHALSLWRHEDVEITMEANPSTAEVDRFKAFRNAGVQRVSIGIQSFDAAALAFLGRNHNAQEGERAITMAQDIFNRVSFDLIYARPDQTPKLWEKELRYALGFGTHHLSLYQLTIEPGTAFAPRYARGEIVIPNESLSSDLYVRTQDIMDEAMLPSYEVSNHARIGHESQHNLIYWRYQDYIGIGAGAHGRFRPLQNDGSLSPSKCATAQYKAPKLWLERIKERENGDHRISHVAPKEQILEKCMMGLRLREGLILSSVDMAHVGMSMQRLTILRDEGDVVFENIPQDISTQAKAHFIDAPRHAPCEKNEHDALVSSLHIRLTPKGRLRLNQVLSYLLT